MWAVIFTAAIATASNRTPRHDAAPLTRSQPGGWQGASQGHRAESAAHVRRTPASHTRAGERPGGGWGRGVRRGRAGGRTSRSRTRPLAPTPRHAAPPHRVLVSSSGLATNPCNPHFMCLTGNCQKQPSPPPRLPLTPRTFIRHPPHPHLTPLAPSPLTTLVPLQTDNYYLHFVDVTTIAATVRVGDMGVGTPGCPQPALRLDAGGGGRSRGRGAGAAWGGVVPQSSPTYAETRTRCARTPQILILGVDNGLFLGLE